jgi:RNA polymerase sigma-B factor
MSDQAPEPQTRESERAARRDEARSLLEQMVSLPADSEKRAQVRDQLVEIHLPLVEHLARRFQHRGEPLDDLLQVATIGLIKSLDRFDLERGVEFSTYATPTILGEIKRHFRDKSWAVRVPRQLQEMRLALTAATAELGQSLNRSPTVAELAKHLGATEAAILEGLEASNAYATISLDAPTGETGDDDSPTLGDTLGSEDIGLVGVEDRESLRPLLAALPARERRILVLRYFGNLTQSQIAEEIGISQMHVSRLLARTLVHLREKLTSGE